MDGGSKDESISVLKKYSQIKWISERDDNSYHAFEKGLDMARGEYIMQCAVTDGYLDMDWLRKCAEALDSDKDISLVWGLSGHMSESGDLMGAAYPQFVDSDPEQKYDYFYYLTHGSNSTLTSTGWDTFRFLFVPWQISEDSMPTKRARKKLRTGREIRFLTHTTNYAENTGNLLFLAPATLGVIPRARSCPSNSCDGNLY